VDNLRNFLLTPTTEMLGFFQQVREAHYSNKVDTRIGEKQHADEETVANLEFFNPIQRNGTGLGAG
jgi:hypothetical protein